MGLVKVPRDVDLEPRRADVAGPLAEDVERLDLDQHVALVLLAVCVVTRNVESKDSRSNATCCGLVGGVFY